MVLARLGSDTNVFSNVLTMNNNVKITNLHDVINNWIHAREDFWTKRLVCFAGVQKFTSQGAIQLGAVWLHSIHSPNIIQYHQKSHDCKGRAPLVFFSFTLARAIPTYCCHPKLESNLNKSSPERLSLLLWQMLSTLPLRSPQMTGCEKWIENASPALSYLWFAE